MKFVLPIQEFSGGSAGASAITFKLGRFCLDAEFFEREILEKALGKIYSSVK
ncbi:MAG: hypothetical protein KME25_32470 [Symplocastrum torsivum CPER-KK1]|uniref:Uncharacterized protein n=1 Tax=Symplocastrum torsivum CPER-KK1 TaxID=450513 RepID=A0A951PUF6_9CYAN|nr:hypothetical protein [Symplocastrum torsivum CPER-KK1]